MLENTVTAYYEHPMSYVQRIYTETGEVMPIRVEQVISLNDDSRTRGLCVELDTLLRANGFAMVARTRSFQTNGLPPFAFNLGHFQVWENAESGQLEIKFEPLSLNAKPLTESECLMMLHRMRHDLLEMSAATKARNADLAAQQARVTRAELAQLIYEETGIRPSNLTDDKTLMRHCRDVLKSLLHSRFRAEQATDGDF